ncbi:hypothetical protein G7B40_010815 [Aetokthonos hydrillicola Thurmond2011]|uniref:Outer membrane protein beta-barrel domain-containing protein n=1 Tax=Aetokthonos hydrillicola Thurmond2011 TaxID=2712845 RepID=A0AAP5MA20_9CYAN|nr:hypothetical protein [Aetokthonos hydrillicola]MDR9895054.1 hypothetical protein [Aetokthonos hydrillicola Thurmond2011]
MAKNLSSLFGNILLGVNVNTIVSPKGVFWLLSFSALAVLGNNSSTVAQTAKSTSTFHLTQASETEAPFSNIAAEEVHQAFTPSVSSQTSVQSIATLAKPEPESSDLGQSQMQFSTSVQQKTASRVVTPIPGTTATSSVAFSSQSTQPTSQSSFPSATRTVKQSASRVAQADINVTPGRVTRGGASYVGVAGNVGLSGSSALGDGNFTVISKIGLTRIFSVRPAAVLGDDPVILLPITYDFNIRSADAFSEPLPFAPYIGGGAAIKTGDNTEAAFLVSGGIDVPLNRQFTATAAVNAAFFSDTDVGLLLGLAYNFRGF